MYLWKVDKLVEDFKSGEVSQKEEVKYILLSTILICLVTDPFIYIGVSYNIYDFLNTILLVSVAVWGVYYYYKINSGGDDKEFIVRGICLGLPIAIRIFVFFIPIFILEITLADFFGEKPISDYPNAEVYVSTPSKVIIHVLLAVSYYAYLGKKYKQVSTSS